MPRYIVKLETPMGARYLEWSTIVDAPVTDGMTLAAFKRHYRGMYGEQGMQGLPMRLARVEQHGTSCQEPTTAEDLLSFNRAGPRETTLSVAQIVKRYCSARRGRR